MLYLFTLVFSSWQASIQKIYWVKSQITSHPVNRTTLPKLGKNAMKNIIFDNDLVICQFPMDKIYSKKRNSDDRIRLFSNVYVFDSRNVQNNIIWSRSNVSHFQYTTHIQSLGHRFHMLH